MRFGFNVKSLSDPLTLHTRPEPDQNTNPDLVKTATMTSARKSLYYPSAARVKMCFLTVLIHSPLVKLPMDSGGSDRSHVAKDGRWTRELLISLGSENARPVRMHTLQLTRSCRYRYRWNHAAEPLDLDVISKPRIYHSTRLRSDSWAHLYVSNEACARWASPPGWWWWSRLRYSEPPPTTGLGHAQTQWENAHRSRPSSTSGEPKSWPIQYYEP